MGGINLQGQRYGRLVVVEHHGVVKVGNVWRCLCDCGGEKVTTANQLRTGKVKSCGCLRRELSGRRAAATFATHGLSRHPLYGTWNSMMQRCHNPNHRWYANYGGRGVVVYDRWRDVRDFIADIREGIGDRPRGASLDRIDNAKGYEPGNVRWATRKQQANNARRNRLLTFGGQTKTLAAWAAETGVNEGAIQNRIGELGWSVEAALTTPISAGHRRRGLAAHAGDEQGG